MVAKKHTRKKRGARTGANLIWRTNREVPKWVVCWRDPETGKGRERVLTDEESETEESRADVVRRKAEELAAKRLQLADQEPPRRRKAWPLTEAASAFLSGKRSAQPPVLARYRRELELFVDWVGQHEGIATANELTADVLTRWNADTVSHRPRLKAGVKPAEADTRHRPDDDQTPLSTATLRSAQANVLAFARWLCREGYSPLMTLPSIAGSVELEPLVKAPQAEHLQPKRMGQLVRQADASDDWAIFRFVLLTGCRIAEAQRVQWEGWDRDQGIVELPTFGGSKSRVVSLDCCPSLPLTLDLWRAEHWDADGEPTGEIFGPGRRSVLLSELGVDWVTVRVSCSAYLASAQVLGEGPEGLERAAERGGYRLPDYIELVSRVRKRRQRSETLEALLGLPLDSGRLRP